TETLEQTRPTGTDTGLGTVLKKLGLQFRRRGLVVMVSDFIGDLDGLGEALGLHTCEGNEVILFRIEDPEERTFPYRGPTVFLGMEQEGKLLCDPRDLRNSYLEARERHIQELNEACHRQGFMLEEAPTDAPLDALLAG